MDDMSKTTAKSTFNLYRAYGLGKFANWRTMKPQEVEREKVVEALRFPGVRKAAEKLLEYRKFQVEELEQMLEEAKDD